MLRYLLPMLLASGAHAAPCSSIDACVQQLVNEHYLSKASLPKHLRTCEVNTAPSLQVPQLENHLVVYTTISACAGGSNSSTEMLLFKATKSHLKLLSHFPVGGKWLSIDTDFVAFVEPSWFYVRLINWPLWPEGSISSEAQYFMRYALVNGQLQQIDRDIYEQDWGGFKLISNLSLQGAK